MASKLATLDSLEREVRDLRKRIDEVAVQPFTVYVTELPKSYRLKRDIPVLIQPTGDDFVATFLDAGISATGDTETEAIFNLKDIMIQTLNALAELPAKTLGKSPKRQLDTLRKLIKRGE